MVNHRGFRKAMELARQKLQHTDFARQCQQAGALMVEADAGHARARLKFIDADYLVDFPSGDVSKVGTGREPPPYDTILILHYLAQARGAPFAGDWISFQQLPDSCLHYPAFRKRVTSILARTFSGKPEDFMRAGSAVAATLSPLGQYALEIRALPRVSCHLLMWPGEDELDTDFNCLFDSSITEYLQAEDIMLLAAVLTSRMVANCKPRPN